MADKKSILEEALLDIKNIQSALNANTKEILRSVAREEIDGVVKESLKEGIYDEEEVETDIEGDTETSEEDSLVDIEGSEEVAPEMEPEMGMDADALGGEEMDMTSASDDDVIAIYKKLSGEDEIEIVGDEIRLTVSEPGEYVIKTSDLGAPAMDDEMEPEMDLEMGDDEEGVDYEIEMGDDEEGEQPSDLMPVDDEEGEEGEEAGEEAGEEEEEIEQIDEVETEEEETIEEKISIGTGMSVGTHRGQGPKSIGAPENPKSESVNESIAAKKLVSETTKKYNMLLTEASKLRAENQEFRTALKEFRNKLVETVVFNSNLTYVTKLFTEHATTKSEKQNIIRRFDEEVSNLKESKKLYKTIVNELETRKPINETVENKIIKEATSSSSKQLNESTAYVDPSTKRILDLINRVEKK
jgi:hypothetical protein